MRNNLPSGYRNIFLLYQPALNQCKLVTRAEDRMNVYLVAMMIE